jgi:hypothetical protein
MKTQSIIYSTSHRPMYWVVCMVLLSFFAPQSLFADNSNTDKSDVSVTPILSDKKEGKTEVTLDKKALLEARKAERLQKREERKNLLQNLSSEERALLKDEIRKAKKEHIHKKKSETQSEVKSDSKSEAQSKKNSQK